MVMKVSNINFVAFKAAQTPETKQDKRNPHLRISELGNITPDFAVKTPQRYIKLGEDKLSDNLTVHRYKLANGYKVTIVPMSGSPAVVKNYVNVGSMNETDDIKGISHFLEHMAFNGTNGGNGYLKLLRGDSFKRIDALGGWTNASTNYAITDYVNSTPLLDDRDIEEQIKIIAAMTEDLALPEETIDKEKSAVCSEINMILDNPETIVIDQAVRTLFNIRSSADELVGGSVKHIQNLDRQKVSDYYETYYTPDNMNLVITGDVEPDKVMRIVASEFRSNKKPHRKKYEEVLVPLSSTVRKDFKSDKATSAEIAFCFAGEKNNDSKRKAVADVLSVYLNTSDFGLNKELKALNVSSCSVKDKINTNPENSTLICFKFSCPEGNTEKVISLFMNSLASAASPDEKTLRRIKDKLIKDYRDHLQYSQNVNNLVGQTTLNGNLDGMTDYEYLVRSVTPRDIDDYLKNYLNPERTAISVVHPSRTAGVDSLSFKGRKRQPINEEKVFETVLENNYKMCMQKTDNNNIYFDLRLYFDCPKNINPAAAAVLNEIYSMGIMSLAEDDFNKLNESDNINLEARAGNNYLSVYGDSSEQNFEKMTERANDLLNNPRILKTAFDRAVELVKDRIERSQDTADSVYSDFESKNNYLYHSKKDLLEGLETLTIDEIRYLHKYIIQNSVGTITMNIPENNPGMADEGIMSFEKFQKVKPFENKKDYVYKKNEYPVVLTKAKNNSQADIKQVYKFKIEDSPKERVIINLLNTILSSSQSIGLFNNLREKEQLAYTVYSNYEKTGDCGIVSLNILTTTDNKETGEFSYDNLQKAINGFNKQVGLLKASKYTDEELENAKKILKANLLNKEGVSEKLDTLTSGMDSDYGVFLQNIAFDEIDKITRADIDYYANKIFSQQPIYSIVATRDTLDFNSDYLIGLENDF